MSILYVPMIFLFELKEQTKKKKKEKEKKKGATNAKGETVASGEPLMLLQSVFIRSKEKRIEKP